MTAPVFVDTNVIVCSQQANETVKQPLASQLLERLWVEQTGRTSVHVLNECYVTLTRKIVPALAAEQAWSLVRNFFVWDPQPIDADLILRAREVEIEHRLSWWHALVVAAAQIQGCALLVSEDLLDGATYGGVRVRNPFKLTVSEPDVAYAAAPVATPRHRPRGRPRRDRALG